MTAQPGDTLRFDLTNEFADPTAPDSGINLHTHGLIVPPRRCPPYGDSVYVEDQPGKTAKFAITIPAKLPGALFWGGGPDHPYPSGLNWFHAHVHGKARIDVMAGQSGLLQVGDTLADLKATPGLNPAAKAALDRTDVRYVALRDIQLRVGADATPDKPTSAGAVAQWLKGDAYSPGACPSQSNPPPKNPPDTPSTAIPGFCFAPDKESTPPTSTVWMFTVNGQAYPTDRMIAGRNQLLRIANLSANVSYLLQISDDAAPDEPKAMDVVTVDGLIAGTVPAGGAGLKVGVQLTSLLLMPAGRAEIFLPAPKPGAGPMTLRTAGITTGSAGDPWPRIDLMRIEAPAAMAATPRMRAAFAPAAERLPEIVLPRNGGASPRAMARMSATAAAAPENCIVLPPGQAARRRITFANSDDGKEFRLGSEVVAGDGTPIDPAHTTVKPSVFPHEAMAAPQSIPHVCARYGSRRFGNSSTRPRNCTISTSTRASSVSPRLRTRGSRKGRSPSRTLLTSSPAMCPRRRGRPRMPASTSGTIRFRSPRPPTTVGRSGLRHHPLPCAPADWVLRLPLPHPRTRGRRHDVGGAGL